jgi:hypothetical protein
MTENDKAIEFLTRMGDLLYGRDWIVPLGREMEISPDLIFNWISRKTPLTMSDDVWPLCARAARQPLSGFYR